MPKRTPTATPSATPRTKPGAARDEILAQAHVDVPFAVLAVAKVLERNGRGVDAAALRMELGVMMIRAALDEVTNPEAVHLGARMAAVVALSRAHEAQVGVTVGVSKKEEATRGR